MKLVAAALIVAAAGTGCATLGVGAAEPALPDAPAHPAKNRAYEVYAFLIDNVPPAARHDTAWISAVTSTGPEAHSGNHVPAGFGSALASFWAENLSPQTLTAGLGTYRPVVLVDVGARRASSRAVLQFSQVGFNTDSTRAVVVEQRACGPECSGGTVSLLFLARKPGREWAIWSEQTWVWMS